MAYDAIKKQTKREMKEGARSARGYKRRVARWMKEHAALHAARAAEPERDERPTLVDEPNVRVPAQVQKQIDKVAAYYRPQSYADIVAELDKYAKGLVTTALGTDDPRLSGRAEVAVAIVNALKGLTF